MEKKDAPKPNYKISAALQFFDRTLVERQSRPFIDQLIRYDDDKMTRSFKISREAIVYLINELQAVLKYED